MCWKTYMVKVEVEDSLEDVIIIAQNILDAVNQVVLKYPNVEFEILSISVCDNL